MRVSVGLWVTGTASGRGRELEAVAAATGTGTLADRMGISESESCLRGVQVCFSEARWHWRGSYTCCAQY